MSTVTSTAHYWFEWHQNQDRRNLKLSGSIDASAATHLSNGLIDLGRRELVVDVTDVDFLSPEAVTALVEMADRLGTGRLRVIVDDGGRGTSLGLESSSLEVDFS